MRDLFADGEMMSLEQLRIQQLEAAIRKHREQKLDDRCWLDDAELYAALGDGVEPETALPPKDVFLKNCERFHRARQSVSNMDDAIRIYKDYKEEIDQLVDQRKP